MPESYTGPKLPSRWVILATLARDPTKWHTRADITAELGYPAQNDALNALEAWLEVDTVAGKGNRPRCKAWRFRPECLEKAQTAIRELVAYLYPPPPDDTIQQIKLALDALKLARRLEESNIEKTETITRFTELAISCGASADEIADARGDS